jgi:ABC-2 type transport system ATP-binding protein
LNLAKTAQSVARVESLGNQALLVETHSLTKRYRDVAALADCTLGVEAGEVFGLLGPNGAGKTTLLRLLLGFLRPTSGKATIDGLNCYRDSVRVHERVSYLPGDARMFRQMRGRDVLQFFADVRPGGDLARSRKLAERLDLDLSRMVAFMSTGMRQKLALAVALACDVPLVVLDEPTSNLDPTVRGVVAALVMEARQEGRTVLFSSHVLSEVEDVCDRVVILRQGRLVHTQVMTELRRKHRIRCQLRGKLPMPPEHLADHMTIHHNGDGALLIETPDELSPLLGWLATLPLEEVRIEPVGLRAIYDRFHAEGTDESINQETAAESIP